MAPTDSYTRLLRLARRRGSVARGEVRDAGIHTHTLSRLVRKGALERVARGRYRLPGAPVTEHHGLALAAAAAPKGVVCLMSALTFHQIGTQVPHQVWLALARGTRVPSIPYPPLRVLHFSGAAFTEGIETYLIEGETVRVYSAAKTVADVFKFRNKVGLDVALEALRDGWRDRRFTMNDICKMGRVCRVEHVMRPYLEALVG